MKRSHRHYLSHDSFVQTDVYTIRDTWLLPEAEALSMPLFPLVVMHSRIRGTTVIRHGNYHLFALEIPLEGELVIRGRDQSVRVEKGTVGVIHPGEDSEILCYPPPVCRKLSILFTGTQLPGLLIATGIAAKMKLIPSDFESLLELSRRIENLLQTKDRANIPELSGLALQLLMLFHDPHPQSAQELLLNRAMDLLRNNIAQSVRISAVAGSLNISTVTLCRLFQERFRKSPKEYLQEIRMERARKLLSSTDEPIKQIAQETGFRSASFFTKSFRELTGLSPSDWRKRQKMPLKTDFLY